MLSPAMQWVPDPLLLQEEIVASDHIRCVPLVLNVLHMYG